jgi:hypothetical protein
MPATVYTPTIERKVIIDHSKPMVDIVIEDLRSIADRWSNVGEQVQALRENPARYSTLQRPVQWLMLDLSRFMSTTIRALDILAADVADHQHEFTTSVQSRPRDTKLAREREVRARVGCPGQAGLCGGLSNRSPA